MNILLVAATKDELHPFIEKYKVPMARHLSSFKSTNHSITILITGVGMVATTFYLTKLFTENSSFDLAINAGIAGAFAPTIKIGEVVYVTEESFGDIGAEDGDNFISIFELGFIQKNEFPYINGKLKSEYIYDHNLRTVTGLTVNTNHGNEVSIEKAKNKFNANIESMEGAAVAYCCSQFKIPWIEIRSISNCIERRDKKNWNIPLAITNLNTWLINFIDKK